MKIDVFYFFAVTHAVQPELLRNRIKVGKKSQSAVLFA